MSLSLRQRILWWSVASTLVVLLATFLSVDNVFRNTILEDQRENLLAGTRLLQELQQSEIEQLQELTASLSTTPTLRAAVETRDRATIRQNLDQLVEATELAWLAVTGPDGEPLAATAGAPEERIAGADRLVDEARFYDTGDLWVRDGGLEQVYASTVFFGSSRLGVLFSGAPVGAERVARLQSGTRQRVAFVADGRLVAGGEEMDGERAAAFLDEWSDAAGESSRAGADDGRDAVREFAIGRDRFLGSSVPLPGVTGQTVGWMVAFRSLDEAMRPATNLRFGLLGIALAGILLAFAASYVLSQRVVRPVNRLLEETVRLGSGELDRPIEAERDDEIGSLARGFEQMRVSLHGAREELVRAERLSAVGRAASAIVHDFRQPVSVIQGYVALLEEPGGDEAQRREDLGVIRIEVARLNEMMGEILDFARGGDGAVHLTRGSVPDLLEDVAAAVRAGPPSQDITVEVEHGYQGEWMLDFPKTRRALENLGMNAAATIRPDGRVRIASERSAEGLRLVVSDDGPGIPDEIRATVFEPFVTHGKKGGTGLGLAIVKAFTERQGGTVRFETSERGTRFILQIPEVGPS
jgi:signal transduction histidine kinase